MHSLRFSSLSRWLVLVAALLCLLVAVSPSVQAQQAPPPDAGVDQLKQLSQTLQDDGRRKELIASIQALIAAKEQAAAAEQPIALGDQLLRYGGETVGYIEDALGDVKGYFGDWPVFFDWVQREFHDPVARQRGQHEALAFLGIFAAGWAAELLLWRLLAGTRRRVDAAAARQGLAKVLPVTARALLDLLPMVGFFVGAYAAGVFLEPTAQVRAVGLHFVNAYLIARVLIAAARLLLAPTSVALRVLPLSDHAALDLYRWFRRFVFVGVGGYFLIGAAFLLGLPRRGAAALLTGLGLIIAIMAVVFILRHRRKVSKRLRDRAGTSSRRLGAAQFYSSLALVWHLLAIAYVIGFFIIAAFRIEGGFAFMLRATVLSVAVFAAAWLLLLGIRRLISHIGHAAGRVPEASPLRRRAIAYLPIAGAVSRLLVTAAALLALLEVWGIGVIPWLQQSWGRRVLSAGFSIGLVMVFATGIWELASSAIERYLHRSSRDGSAIQHSARIRTLLPLLRKALFVFLSIMVVMITLSELGIDIAPLLAGAGVVGLAIGFGAQKLVQDIITGVFMLVEDALSVGDVVNVAGLGGVVEDMSIRSIRLRDAAGSVHTVPFSSVSTVTNLTKDFSYYVLDINVAYRENTDEVTAICRQIVDEMRKDPRFSNDILEPLEVLGVDQFLESSVLVKARIKTRASRQWAVGREFNGRLKRRFDEEQIEMPYPHRTIYLGVDKHGEAPPLHVHVDRAVAAGSPSPQTPSAPMPPEPASPTPKPAAPDALTPPRVGGEVPTPGFAAVPAEPATADEPGGEVDAQDDSEGGAQRKRPPMVPDGDVPA